MNQLPNFEASKDSVQESYLDKLIYETQDNTYYDCLFSMPLVMVGLGGCSLFSSNPPHQW